MHSSRMRTTNKLTIFLGSLPPGERGVWSEVGVGVGAWSEGAMSSQRGWGLVYISLYILIRMVTVRRRW